MREAAGGAGTGTQETEVGGRRVEHTGQVVEGASTSRHGGGEGRGAKAGNGEQERESRW